MRMSALAYHPSTSDILDMTCPRCTHQSLRHVVINDVIDGGHGTRVIVAYDLEKEAIILAFRGTANSINWQQNFKTQLVCPEEVFPRTCEVGVKIHEGFYESYQALRKELLKTVKGILGENFEVRQVFFTGHSMGGALATICSLEMDGRFPLLSGNIAVYSFGSPRVGNEEFASLFSSSSLKSVRVAHVSDPVTHVPLELLGYRHVGHEVVDPEPHPLTPLSSHLRYLGVTAGAVHPERMRRGQTTVLEKIGWLLHNPLLARDLQELDGRL